MARRLLRSVLGLALVLIFSVQLLADERCQQASAHNKHLGVEITDPRVVSATVAVVEASGLKAPIVLCELHMPYINATVDHAGGFYLIGLTKTLIQRTTDAELRAVIGHEIAHIVLGHRGPVELTHQRTAKSEENADELAARWFGKEPMVSVLHKLRDDAAHLQPARLREQADAELEVRVKALQ
jgi:Zn-dependent protease with chaperone function